MAHCSASRAPPPVPKMAIGLPVSGFSKYAMFSTIPSTGTPVRSNIFTPRSASPTATCCGVVTITAPCTGVAWTSDSWASPVPGGMSTRK